ncbi:MAG: PspC domain-containing protein [Propionibacteriaceae bacterium]|nr:PspC domain-containing protein [Propionibacteriaceae bacterium]
MHETLPVKPPRAYRLLDRGVFAGVAAGLAFHSRIPVWAIRAAFIVASVWKFSGAVAYAVLWVILPYQEKRVPIGLVAAERQGRRTVVRRTPWWRIFGPLAVYAAGGGIAVVIWWYDASFIGRYAVFGWAVGAGIALVWLARETAWRRAVKALVTAAGVLIAWIAGTFVQARVWAALVPAVRADLAVTAGAFLVSSTTIAGLVVLLLPWFVHPARSEEDKQAELIAETRADMAAHLHDSVLQTLAVIQKRSGDAKEVSKLARRQEKELREWLYGEPLDDESATAALKEVVAELEADYPVVVELVTVGDQEMTVEIDAVVRAVREAILNAAKHSGVEKIDVYAEMSNERAEAYVRDRGRGFVIADIGDDRLGIRHSIIDRMSRYGGHVDIRSTPGEGTEIHLSMPLTEEGTGHE